MISKVDKAKYLGASVLKKLTGWKSKCPYCKTDVAGSRVVDSKFVFTALVECKNCNMLVRTPTDDVVESNSFYQEAYSQEYTTDCPPKEELDKLMAQNFEGTDRDYTRYINFFRFLNVPTGARVLDFGCSWGYGLYQFRAAGFNAEGFEVSLPRGRYGKEMMNLNISSSVKSIQGKFDVIFSSHVLEHLPDFTEINHLYENNLADNGLFIAVTPNGSEAFLKADFNAYHQIWGKVHPVLVTDRFVKKNFGKELTYMDSWKSMRPEFKSGSFEPVLDKFELVYVLKARV